MSSVAAAMVGFSQSQTQTSLATTFMKQNASAEAGIAAVLEQNAQSATAAAKAPPAGLGGAVDVTV
ncbi:hypothetical protein [Stappia sp.]|uniref:hypothetical protein n=1 Tax=Stappia sp. TaxID=1870903 RepID=UPI003A9A2394